MDVYVTYGHTESGDDLRPIVWDRLPNASEVVEVYRSLYPDEFAPTDGDAGALPYRNRVVFITVPALDKR